MKNVFSEQIVRDNFKRLEAAGGSFDLNIEPSQYEDALKLLDTVPNLTVILGHRGVSIFTPPNIAFLQSQEYWDAMKKFAARPKTYIKLSFFACSDFKWKRGDIVIEKAIELVKLFGANRCMFATNFPIDNMPMLGGWTMKDMLKTYKEIAKDFTPAEQACLYRETAFEAYRMK